MGFLNNVKTAFESNKNFKYLDDLIHSGVKEISLESDIVLGSIEKFRFKEGIKLDVDDLVIDGNNHTIYAKGKTRIFHCTAKNITLKNIILKNGYADVGGAINNENGTLTLTNFILQENTAKHNGGAINNETGTITISDSTLIKNTAKNGGAIFNKGKLKISDSTLNNNTASKGGAIFAAIESKIKNSIFQENAAEDDGGAIYNVASILELIDSTLNNNTANNGRTIYNSSGSFKIFNCNISRNKSFEVITNQDYLEVRNTNFKENKSRSIILNSREGNLGIFNGMFKENNVDESILANYGKSCIIEKTVFENNLTSTNIKNDSKLTLRNIKINDEGKTIINKGHISIKNEFPNLLNKIIGEGEVNIETDVILTEKKFDFGYLDKKIHESKSKEIILEEDIHFENYEIDYYEGGIELDIDDLIIDGNGKIIDGSHNSRIFIVTGDNIILKNIIFKNGHSHKNYDNHLNDHGGAIKTNYNIHLIIENCKFISNNSEKCGGAIFNMGKLTIINSNFDNNTAEYGGAIYDGIHLTTKEAVFSKNLEYKGIELTIKNSIFQQNTAQSQGGAICHSSGTLTMTNSPINNNTAHDGGGIFNTGELTISDALLQKNTSYNGGAIFNKGKLRITDSTLINNTASKGGAIYNLEGTLSTINSAFNSNTSRGESIWDGGGAIHNRSSILRIKDSTFNNNTAQRGGSALNNYKGSLKITGSVLNNNTSQKDGGVIHNYDEKYFNMVNCKSEGNMPDVITYRH